MEDSRWEALDLEALSRSALLTTCEVLSLDPAIIEVSLLACDDARIAELNADHRAKPVPTNVLSWPAEDLAAEASGGRPAPPAPGPDGALALGDIAIAFETCAREAAEMGKTMPNHVLHLLVHGSLHLLGYDHVEDPDADLMQGLETEILGKMGLDDPYS